jgi:glutamyl-tRNA synthetase
MEITHVLRGEEWISSTPKHLLLYKAFGWEPTVFAHMPLIRNADKSKLSKRKNDVSILSYRDKGYLPEALLNFIALLGWSHPEGKEIFSFEEFLQVMSLERIQKTGPVFDTKKLDWMNGVYIRNLALPELEKRLEPFLPSDFPRPRLPELLPLVIERLVTLKDIEALTAFFYREISHPEPSLLWKKSSPQEVVGQLTATQAQLESIEDWSAAKLEETIRTFQEQQSYKKSQYFMLLRVAATGQTATPPLFETLAALGKKLTLERFSQALELAAQAANKAQ